MVAKTNTSDVLMKHNASAAERDNRHRLLKLLKEAPIPDSEILMNLPLFLTRQNLSQMLFIRELYEHVVAVHGVIFEFGVRWGRNLALYESFRGIYEPFNHNRRIVGFDTFEGFPSVDPKDGDAPIVQVGAYNVTAGYDAFLAEVLDRHEFESPISHIKKYELVRGDASKTVPAWLAAHPETIVAFAYFDFDIYEPTLNCLKAIKPHLTKGSVIGFDELNAHDYPGETRAVAEVLGLGAYAIRHSRYSPTQSYLIVE